MQLTVSREMAAHKRLALVAHDNKKMDLVRWVKVRGEQLKLHHLYATGTTGTVLSREAGLPITCLFSGPMGGDQQLGAMIAEGKMQHEQLEDIGKMIVGEARGRKNDDEIIIMSVGGMPVEDVAWATVVYRNAVEQGIGVKLNLWDTPTLR